MQNMTVFIKFLSVCISVLWKSITLYAKTNLSRLIYNSNLYLPVSKSL